MKKIATVFTAILLAAAMLLPQAMLADQGAVFTMNGTDNVPAGGTFDVTLSVSGEYAIHAAHLVPGTTLLSLITRRLPIRAKSSSESVCRPMR